MKHGSRRRDTLPDIALNWRAPSSEGGGEPGEADKQPTTLDRLKSMVTPRDGTRGEGAGEPVKVSGLAAESSQAGCAGGTLPGERRFWVAQAESSGLAAEGVEAAATSTTPTAEGDSSTSCEPGAGAPRPKVPPYFMVFDVESIGLHGEGFAYGYVVLCEHGNVVDENRASCPRHRASGLASAHRWVAANVPPILEICSTPADLRTTFWIMWRAWAAHGAVLVADVAWPVEARFLAACVDDDPANRAPLGPYPLHELTSIALALGADIESLWSERLPCELPAHDPLNDARHSARILAQLLGSRATQ